MVGGANICSMTSAAYVLRQLPGGLLLPQPGDMPGPPLGLLQLLGHPLPMPPHPGDATGPRRLSPQQPQPVSPPAVAQQHRHRPGGAASGQRQQPGLL